MSEFEPGIESGPRDFAELSQMLESGEGEIPAADFRRIAEAEDTPENVRAIVKTFADLIEQRDKWGTDSLTGLMSESRLNHSLEGLFKRSQKSGGVITVVLYDLDNLKIANSAGDGHAGGDNLIKAFAQDLSAVYNNSQNGEYRTGIVGRWRRGDEFLAIIRGDEKLGQDLEDKFQAQLKGRTVTIASRPHPVSATGVVCQLDPKKDLASQLEETSRKLLVKKDEAK